MKKNYFKTIFRKSLMVLFIATACFLSNNTHAQEHINWTGAVNNNWDDAGNWNISGVTVVAPVTTASFKITLTAANNDISVGDFVEGYGIAHGSKITEIAVDKKVITLDLATYATVAAPGTSITFTYATPKSAVSVPTSSDIAVINNGGNPTLPSGFITVSGLIVGNRTGAITGSTLTIPKNTEFTVESSINEPVVLRGGNIINNGALIITSFLATGGANLNSAYGFVCTLPTQLPTVPTTYTYSGTGSLEINTSAGSSFSGGFHFNGNNAIAENTTYKILFDGPTAFILSDKLTGTTTNANTQLIRVLGGGAFKGMNVVLGGKGFDLGNATNGGKNGLLSASGAGASMTIEAGTTINVYSDATSNATVAFQMYVFGNNTQTQQPQRFVNKGTLNFKGSYRRPVMALYAEVGTPVTEFENQGVLDFDVEVTTAGNAALLFSNFSASGDTKKSITNFINSGTLNIKQPLSGPNAGSPILVPVTTLMPYANITNSGTMNIDAAAFASGGRAFNPAASVDAPQGSKFINSGTVNTNVELRTFETTNTSTGTISFVGSNKYPVKITTFTVVSPTLAAVGTTYTDVNGNIYTVVVDKPGATSGQTSLVTRVNSAAVNPPTVIDAITGLKPTLTKTGSGAGDATINFTAWTTINDNALFQPIYNSGKLNTNAGVRLMTGINGFNSPNATSILSIGGDNANGEAFIENRVDDLLKLRGILKMNVTGSTTSGVDYDQLKLNGEKDYIDISEATLDVTGIYTPTVATTIDIITTNTIFEKEGGITNGSPFANVVGLTSGWSVNYTGAIGGKVQLVYDTLGTSAFETFKFSVSPNPTSGLISISAANTIDNVVFYNVFGQKVKTVNVNEKQKQFDISGLQKGVYIMRATIGNAKKSFKIVKQ